MRTTPSPRLIGFKNSGTTPDFGVAVRALSFSMHIYTVNDNERPVSIAYFYTSKNFFHSPEIKIRHSYYQFKPISTPLVLFTMSTIFCFFGPIRFLL